MVKMLETANALQDELDSLGLPPAETTPSHSHSVIDIAIVRGTRGYIEVVAHQVNKCYDSACYDACAVMLRRLLETLIIELFEAKGVADHIKLPTGEFMQLRGIIEQLAKEGWDIGRKRLPALNRLKEMGDRSAHDRYYRAMRRDIDNAKDDLRLVVQGLILLANLK